MSKGSGRRPAAISDEELARRWAAIFQASEAAQESPLVIEDEEPPEGWPECLPGYHAKDYKQS